MYCDKQTEKTCGALSLGIFVEKWRSVPIYVHRPFQSGYNAMMESLIYIPFPFPLPPHCPPLIAPQDANQPTNRKNRHLLSIPRHSFLSNQRRKCLCYHDNAVTRLIIRRVESMKRYVLRWMGAPQSRE